MDFSKLKGILLIAGVCLFHIYSINGQADTKFVNEFLNIGVGARAHGMSGSVTASTEDVTAAYWNPAGLSYMDAEVGISAMHASWFGGIANYDYVGFGKVFNERNKSYGSASLIRMGVDNIPNTLNLIGPDGSVNFDNILEFSAADYAFILSYAQQVGGRRSGLTLGGSAKVIFRQIGDFGTARGFGFDLAAMYKEDRFQFGVMLRDITTTVNTWSFSLTPEEQVIFERTNNDIPISSTEVALPKIIVGGAFKSDDDDRNAFSYLVEADVRFSTDGTQAGLFSGNNIGIDPSFGAEIGYNRQVFFRAGLGNIQRTLNETSSTDRSLEFQPNVGLGIVLGNFQIDYALANIGSVSGVLVSHIFSLSLQIRD
jgi:hypothetical protein